MKLNRAILTLTTLALLAGAAQAQQIVKYDPLGTGEAQIAGPASPGAQVQLDIALTVPVRYGLHLHRDNWTLDLASLDADNTYSDGSTNTEDGGLTCYRAGEHDASTGRDVVYPIMDILNNPLSSWVGDSGGNDPLNPYDYQATLPFFDEAGENYPFGGVSSNFQLGSSATPRQVPDILRADSYPGFQVSAGALLWKGPIMCTFQTIVQKFSNVPNSNFTAELDINIANTSVASWPATIVADRFTNPDAPLNNSLATLTNSVGNGVFSAPVTADAFAVTLVPGGATQTLADFAATSTTGGWLDNNVLVALVFDGRELGSATQQDGTITFNLFSPAPAPVGP